MLAASRETRAFGPDAPTAKLPALPGDWDGLVVYCAGTSWDGNRLPDQHIAERLARYAPVLYVDPPISHLTARLHPELADSMRKPHLRLLAPRLARLTPVVLPGKGRLGIRVLTHALTRRALSRAVHALGGSVLAVVVASLEDLFGICGERHKVLYATDDFVAGAQLMGISASRLERDERHRLREADIVVACSAALADKWRDLGRDPILVPNGVDDQLFASTDDAPLPKGVRLQSPIAGFVGHLSDRIDLAYLEAVAARGRSLLIVGPRAGASDRVRLDRLLSRENVQWVGAQPFATLPSYLRVIDVGLVPYRDSPFNRASFPLKTLEYLAAGRAAVATDLPAVRWLETELVEVASDTKTFADAVDRALIAPRSPALVAQRQTFAGKHSWDRRTEAFAQTLGIYSGSPSMTG